MKGMKMIAVNTSLGTNFLLSAPRHVSFAGLRDLIKEEHLSCFPDYRDIEIGALTVEYDGKQYHITDSLFVGQVFKKGWSKINAEVSSPSNKPADARGKSSGNLDIPSAEFSEAGTDVKLQGSSGRKHDQEDAGPGNFTQKNAFLAQKSFGCSLLFIEGPYTQPLPGTNMPTLVTFGTSTKENNINWQKDKFDAQKGSMCSDKSFSERYKECKQNLDCREQVGTTKCTRELQQSTSVKCLQAKDNTKRERSLRLDSDGLHDVTALGCTSAPAGGMLDQKMGFLIKEGETSSLKVNGLKLSANVEPNVILHNEKLPNGGAEIMLKEGESSSPKVNGLKLLGNVEPNVILHNEKLPNGGAKIANECNSGSADDGELNEKVLDFSLSEHKTASPLNLDSIEKEEEQVSNHICYKVLSLQASQQPVNSGHRLAIECLHLEKTCSSTTKSNSEYRNEVDTFRDKISQSNGHMTDVRDSLQDDAMLERSLCDSRGHHVNDKGCSARVPLNASADMVPETQESQMGTQICASAVKDMGENKTREGLKKLDRVSGDIMEGTDSKRSRSSRGLQNVAEQNGSENTKAAMMMGCMCADGLNTLDKDRISRLVLPKKHEKHKMRLGLQIHSFPGQEDSSTKLRQNLAPNVLEQKVNIGVERGMCNNNTDFQETHGPATYDQCALVIEKCIEESCHIQRKIQKQNTEGFGRSENGSGSPPFLNGDPQKRSLLKGDACDARVQSLGEDKDTVKIPMDRSGSTDHCREKPVREEHDDDSERTCQTPGKALERKPSMGSMGTLQNPKQVSSQKNCIVGKEIMNMALGKLRKRKRRRKMEQDNMEIWHNNNADIDRANSQDGIAEMDESASNCLHRKSPKLLAKEGKLKDVTAETNVESAGHNTSLGKKVKKRKSKRKCRDSGNARNVDDTSFKGNEDHNTVDALCACAEKDVTGMGVEFITRKNSLDVFEFSSHETASENLETGSSPRRKLGKKAEQVDRVCSKGVKTVLDDDLIFRKRSKKSARRSSTPKRSIPDSKDKFMQNQNSVKGFSKEVSMLLMAQRVTKPGGCLKESVVRDQEFSLDKENVEEATLQESSQTTGDKKMPCPAGCGRLYAGKTSSWYRHRRKCSGKCL